MVVSIAMFAAPSAAQGLEFGVKGGVGMSTVSNVSEITETSDAEAGRQFGPVFGGFVGISLGGSRLSIQPEALLTWKGATLDDDGDGETLRMRYLDVPLLVKLTAPSGGDEKALYVLGGLNLGFALGADVHADDADQDISDRIKSTDFGLTVGAGLQARRWLVEGRYTEGLVNIAVDDSDDPVQTRMFAVLVGIRF
jgi:hypothetical protein